jgi:hypothetical protein
MSVHVKTHNLMHDLTFILSKFGFIILGWESPFGKNDQHSLLSNRGPSIQGTFTLPSFFVLISPIPCPTFLILPSGTNPSPFISTIPIPFISVVFQQ